MKHDGRLSLFDRIVAGTTGVLAGDPGLEPAQRDGVAGATGATGTTHLSGAELEQAYRQILLEYQVLAESNERLHQRLALREAGIGDSPAAQRLLREQRNALVERSHRLREVDYENKLLQRQHEKLVEENRRLTAELARRNRDLELVRAALQHKSAELAAIKAQYQRLRADSKSDSRLTTAANGNF